MMKMIGMAHRGHPLNYPENTMAGIESALHMGFTHLEIDVQLSLDGIPVIIHDTTVDRTSNGTGPVCNMTLEQLKQLDFGNGEKIPTLVEVFDLVKDRIIIDLELKQLGNLYPDLEAKAVDTIRMANMDNQVIVTSFDHYAIKKVKELDSGIRTGLITYGTSPYLPVYAKKMGHEMIAINYHYITEAFMEDCQKADVQVVAWTVDSIEDMGQLARLYPKLLICTNNLEGFKKMTEDLL